MNDEKTNLLLIAIISNVLPFIDERLYIFGGENQGEMGIMSLIRILLRDYVKAEWQKKSGRVHGSISLQMGASALNLVTRQFR